MPVVNYAFYYSLSYTYFYSSDHESYIPAYESLYIESMIDLNLFL